MSKILVNIGTKPKCLKKLYKAMTFFLQKLVGM